MMLSTPSRLALFGGPRTIDQPLARFNSIGSEEAEAARAVIETGVLSRFIGAWGEDFYGGPQVLEFERRWESHFDVAHAVSFNSLTSGLIAAVGAAGIEPGDEVIVSPWTMCATATAVLHWNAIPVFADIEAETYCIDPASVEANITPHTRAIIAVDIFGQSADVDALRHLSAKHGLKLISDTAQAPGATYRDRFAGTLTDIGGFSLNYHKHIHTGEGGVMVTGDGELAERMRLIRNHAEAVVGPKGVTDLSNMVGYNFRLGEIEAAIGSSQLKKLEPMVRSRQRAASRLTDGLSGLPGLLTPVVREGCTHSYYIYALRLDPEVLGVQRDRVCAALQSEGLPVFDRYQNLHLLPMYQQKIAYGRRGFPWTSDICRRTVDYRKGICPTAERLNDAVFLGLPTCMYDLDDVDVDLIVSAFRKVWHAMDVLGGDGR